MNGYCPKCGSECHAVLVNGRGYCERHGWIWVNWNPPKPSGGMDMQNIGRPTLDRVVWS